ncbi:helix-turn-helix domain-containing protein [Arsenicicoccus dermatophilus]|uniref:helix-turn-helix domain-containing protein n=1 Tax=Arsenicicoccus dermatophilus TaxID=1076331 RepID=UPI001F4C6A30|nr:helix-turn-helix domain-containing protein [Arsenicicoccus dermatophilus]MCH8613429.1 helix-turn-helix domain-containing protein [Arsenicicoccus dermatophilus]
MPTDATELIAVTRPKAAELTGLPESTIHAAIHSDGRTTPRLRARRIGRRIVIPITDLRDWIAQLDEVA